MSKTKKTRMLKGVTTVIYITGLLLYGYIRVLLSKITNYFKSVSFLLLPCDKVYNRETKCKIYARDADDVDERTYDCMKYIRVFILYRIGENNKTMREKHISVKYYFDNQSFDTFDPTKLIIRDEEFGVLHCAVAGDRKSLCCFERIVLERPYLRPWAKEIHRME